MNRLKNRLVAVAIVLSVFLGLRYYNKSRSDEKVKSQIRDMLQKLPSYEKEAAYLNEILDASHESAFESAYKLGGRRRSAKFNAEKYVSDSSTA